MKKTLILTISFLLSLSTSVTPAQEGAVESDTPTSVTAQGAELTLLTDECNFTEGPAVDQEGNVYFTDQPNDRIMKIDLEGKLSQFMKPAGRSNGMFFAPDGKLITCADEKNEMWEIDVATKERKVLFGTYSDKILNGPNDVWIHPSGTMYFTDPYYQRDWWEHKQRPQDVQALYRVDRDGSNLQRLPATFTQPNGIIGNAEEGKLYVADIGARKTYLFTIAEDGSLSEPELFCEQGSDGMTLDAEGNLYLTGRGVSVYNPAGEKIQQIDVDENWTANVCFGGADRKTLYITASDSVYTMKMRTSGL